MKKVLFILVLALISFASCSNEDFVSENESSVQSDSVMVIAQRNMELIALQNRIHEYNVGTFTSYQNFETRGWLKNLFKKTIVKWIVTIASDAIGGACGGIAGGLVASGTVGALVFSGACDAVITPWNTRASCNIDGDSLYNSKEIVFRNVVPDLENLKVFENDSIGYYHNKILYGMFNNQAKMATFMEKDMQGQAQMIVEEMANEPYLLSRYGDELRDVENINNGLATANIMIQIANDVETEDEFFARIGEAGLTDPNIISVMKEIISGLQNVELDTDDGQYYQEILKIISDSNLDEETKLRLSDGVIIGQASNHLWLKKAVTFSGTNWSDDNLVDDKVE